MRKPLLFEGVSQLEYEIRNIVKKAEQVEQLGQEIYWENIGDPIQKNATLPAWIKEIITNLMKDDKSYGYCHSKGILETREFLAKRNNAIGGAQITANDILFFNGLGDAISKLYQFLKPSSRIIGPAPAYATHSSAEATHANAEPLTYRLDPENNWFPDLDDLYNQVKYNPNIIGILIINPDNPTGMVYPLETLKRIVAIAKEFNLMVISDEVYYHVTYNGAKSHALAALIEEVPGIALKGISKALPWPGSRCGWMEFYNRPQDEEFSKLCETLERAKMTEVCATTLPQKAIPLILGDNRFMPYRKKLNEQIGERSKMITEMLKDIPYITFNETFGAFYNTIVFKKDVLKAGQKLATNKPEIQTLLDKWITDDLAYDKQFVYYLLAVEGVCVVPLSSFHSELMGFRVTLLEENKELLQTTFLKIRKSILDYCRIYSDTP